MNFIEDSEGNGGLGRKEVYQRKQTAKREERKQSMEKEIRVKELFNKSKNYKEGLPSANLN